MFGGVYAGRRVLLTGHTGFKGSWLALWLRKLGARVAGLALPPPAGPSHWTSLDLDIPQTMCDIRDRDGVLAVLGEWQPEVVFHLAAQALVRPSYEDPVGTWATNVMGTTHVLDACRLVRSVQTVVVVTSDKCYENQETGRAFREDDPMGGHDPYSASKGATELVVASYRRSFFSLPGTLRVATARAGNVFGGGDWSCDRLVPDVVRGMQSGQPASIRHPEATRPWQHVLEPLSGYLLLGQRLLEDEPGADGAWNFGPPPEATVSVAELLEGLQRHWPGLAWRVRPDSTRHEATLLRLDSRKANEQLHWQPVWSLAQGIDATSEWYSRFLETGEVRSNDHLDHYVADAQRARATWARA